MRSVLQGRAKQVHPLVVQEWLGLTKRSLAGRWSLTKEVAMERAEFLKQLGPLNEDELFYRDYYAAAASRERLDAFLAQLTHEEIARRKLIVPEVAPDLIPTEMEDTEYFPEESSNSVFISRHNRYTPGFLHRHKFFEITYVYSGSCTQMLGLRHERFDQGDVCLISPGVYHTMEVFDDETLVFNILLRHSTFSAVFNGLSRGSNLLGEFFTEGMHGVNSIQFLTFHASECEGGMWNFPDLYLEQLHPDEYTDQIMVGELTRGFALMMRACTSTAEIAINDNSGPQASFPVMNYIEQNIDHVTLSDVAEHFGFSVPYCSRLIKKSTGHSLSEWKRSIRVERAKRELRGSRRSVAEIGARLGYANPETFIRAFEKECGMSPTAFRRQ